MPLRCVFCGATTADLVYAVVYDPWAKYIDASFGPKLEPMCTPCLVSNDLFCFGHDEPRPCAYATVVVGKKRVRKRPSKFYSCCASCLYEVLMCMPSRRYQHLLDALVKSGRMESYVSTTRLVAGSYFEHMSREQAAVYGLMVYANLFNLTPEKYLPYITPLNPERRTG